VTDRAFPSNRALVSGANGWLQRGQQARLRIQISKEGDYTVVVTKQVANEMSYLILQNTKYNCAIFTFK
jgi:hypothetical protein